MNGNSCPGNCSENSFNCNTCNVFTCSGGSAHPPANDGVCPMPFAQYPMPFAPVYIPVYIPSERDGCRRCRRY